MKNVKEKIYHKLINNELKYDTKSIVRYGKKSNKNMNYLNTNKISQLEKLKKFLKNSLKMNRPCPN